MNGRRKIVVAGALANKYLNGGEAWVRLNWVLGFRKLGFDVYFVEQIGRATCVDSSGVACGFEESANRTYFEMVTKQFGLDGASSLVYEGGEKIHGMSYADLQDVSASAELLVNITGHLTDPALMRPFRRKAYVDIDPGFTQFWHAAGNTGLRLEGHEYYFTIGENIGTADCPIPTGDIRWRRTRQPVVLEEWPYTTAGRSDYFTTVGSWRGPYGGVEYGGKTFGLKVHEFRKFIELPGLAPQTFELALNIHPAEEKDIALLNRNGWKMVDPRSVAADASAFRAYVQGSGAEFSVAQGVYVETNSGWFSDRTVRYLASGKPALVQDTGFSRNYPVGEGLVPFSTMEEAVAGAERIAGDYATHSRAARRLAEEYFDSDKVLGSMLEEVGVAP